MARRDETDEPCLVLRRGALEATCPIRVGVCVDDVRGIVLSGEAQQIVVLHWSADRGGNASYVAAGVQVWSISSARRLLAVTTEAAELFWEDDAEEPEERCRVHRRALIDAEGAIVRRRVGSRAPCVVEVPDRRWDRQLGGRAVELRWPRRPPAIEGWPPR